MYWIYWISVFLGVSCISHSQVIDVCVQTGKCSCENSKGTIDLTPLALNNGKAKFEDKTCTINNDLFSWNPCNDFTEGSCTSVAVCQIQTFIPSIQITIGTQSSARMVTNQDGKVTLEYTATTEGTTRTTKVVLTCDETVEADLIVTGESPTEALRYDMELKSKYACARAVSGGSSLSIGSILLIAAVGCAFLYLICGVIFQIVIRKAEGRERFPNYTFWVGFPKYVRDGVLFIVRRGKISKSYDSI